MRQQHQHNDEDDHGVLKDGQRLRVPMYAMDSVQKAIAREALRVTDGSGGTQGLHRPGFRIPTTDADDDAVCAAHADYQRELCDSWKKPVGFGGDPSITGAGEHGQQGSREGDPCMRDGLAGVLRMGAAGLYCDIGDDEPDDASDNRSVQQIIRDHQERMSDVYAAHDAEISQAWRRK
jgi:hypothetical protein